MELTDPPARPRRYLGGPELKSLTVRLKSTTPILGGAPVTRKVDRVDIIRAPTIRGHLRFWWRALYAPECSSASELARHERELWGGVGSDEGTRSQVEVRVEVDRHTARDDDQPVDLRRMGEDAYYALWPARAMRGSGAPDAERLMPELRFMLRIMAPEERIREVENALRAWVLWGGYGGRTRRGVGSLTVEDDMSKWLPRSARVEDLRQVFGGLALLGAPPHVGARQVPVLQGARLYHGRSEQKPERAWLQALHWLREFRQGQSAEQDPRPAHGFARERGSRTRPGRSRWPEPDKIRRLFDATGKTQWAHLPRAEYSKAAAWPRAGFGLPVGIRFQDKDRANAPYRLPEPGDVELRWQAPGEQGVRERLASPLIVKAMPLANGSFAPIALWLHRAWPEGKVVLVRKGKREPVPGSAAPFDRLVAPGDTPLYEPLKASSLREAFFIWLEKERKASSSEKEL